MQNYTNGPYGSIQFVTNSVPRLTVGGGTLAGYVGIGTGSPISPLTIMASSSTDSGGLVIRADDGTTYPVRLYSRAYNGLRGGTLDLYYGNTQNARISAESGLSNYLNNGGNFGIGTPTPRSRLDIGSSLGAGNGARFGDYLEINEREAVDNANTIGWNAYVAANDGTFAPSYALCTGMVLSMSSGGTADLDFWGRNWAGSASAVSLPAFTHVMRLSTNGNVGIGTTNPTQKLSVAGTVRAYAVVVDTGWSDYVFKPDYKLASLSEVEGAIKKDGHLPGIPSAAEVAEHGVSLGDMQSKLLAKVEELTLHLIEQDKRMSAQQNEIAALKSQNASFQKRLGELRTSPANP